MNPNTKIKFGTDGWRDTYQENFNEKNIKLCIIGLVKHILNQSIESKPVVVGYDSRYKSKEFAEIVVSTLNEHNIQTFSFDSFAPTPACSIAVKHYQASYGVMITASHNSKEWNGIKIKYKNGGSAPEKDIEEIEKNIYSGINIQKSYNISSNLDTKFDVHSLYIKKIFENFDIDSVNGKLKIVVDYMHGSGSNLVKKILKNTSHEVIEIRGNFDPEFPNMVQPEPIEKNLKPLMDYIKENNADLGIAFDGDADRLGIVDEKGNYISTLNVFSILSDHILSDEKSLTSIVCNINMSSTVEKIGEKYNCKIIRTPVGFKNIAPIFEEKKSILGGEESGGYAFRNHIPERDGILSALYFLQSMIKSNQSPSNLLDKLHKEFGYKIYHRIDKEIHPEIFEDIRKNILLLKPEYIGKFKVLGIDTLDGIKFFIDDDSWVSIRVSGTEPLLRIYIETKDYKNIEEISNSIMKDLGIK